MNQDDRGLATRLLHGRGANPLGAVAAPIFDTASFAMADIAAHRRTVEDPSVHDYYSRVRNPTVAALESTLASPESAPRALAFASGMAAITTALLALGRRGGHFIASDQLFVNSREWLAHDLPDFGCEVTFVDLTDLTSLDAAFRPTTRAVFFEEFTNPLLDVLGIETIVAITHDHDALAVVDNTFATPVLIRTLELGADIVIHSATKYLAGHGRVLAGALAGGGPAMDAIAVMRRRLGTIITPHNAAAVIEGMSTLELRVDRASATALRLAELADAHHATSAVNYPGLPSAPAHEFACRLTGGRRFGGMLSFALLRPERKAAVYDAFTRFIRATSLGDVVSLVDSVDDPDVLRLSVGTESADELLVDLEKALDAAL
ncbi:PLP-dependent transferase [Streptomyces sp. PRh5]|uniref:trans-sulfuration enzyme family protein n=1 Tax=Streptomyces sp. PRh5 TaxID=1158056 RepID=UPI0004BB8B2C|nr:PLP-dependent transferase [Streptomyces sp. PRh5]